MYCIVICLSYIVQRCGAYTPLPSELKDKITIARIKEAADVITTEGYVRKTPLIDGSTINGPGKEMKLAQVESFLMKCENMQFSG